ncbi:MAG: SAM-dependent methyltransferase [Pirellulales bacterium]|nr:SAM-dependent methyltransferase [Pirellulales bacterium]
MDNQFIFVTCQIGSEQIIKKNLVEKGLRFAFSRPGFLTFKIPHSQPLFDSLELNDPFVRSAGRCLGKVQGESDEQRALALWDQVADIPFDRLHVWPRDRFAAGQHHFNPGLNDGSRATEASLRQTAPATRSNLFENRCDKNLARRNERVLDCIVVEADEWWVGAHFVDRWVQRWPGGFWEPEGEVEMISRAYLKMSEALAWLAWPIKAGQRCVELGCAPGGASQALLDCGMRVAGIDPAQVDPRVEDHPEFQHIRKRSGDVRVRNFQEFQWLTADINLAPEKMLDEVERIVAHQANRVRGVILTAKLQDWNLADRIPKYLERIGSWGYPRLRARQLSHNRQEVCLAGLRPQRKHRRLAMRRSR